MTGVVVVIVVVTAVVVVGVALALRFGRNPTPGAERAGQPWLVEAQLLIDEGRRLSEQVAGVLEGGIDAGSGVESADPSAGLDRLTSRLAELSATAPTAMDVRVCRSVAVRSRALSEVLRSPRGCDPTISSKGRRAVPPGVDDRRREFDIALLDLAEHVELL